jgi:hypothetical protein
MADLVDCSRPTIQAIELLKLPLSESLAQRISYQTGIDPRWLLAKDPNRSPVSREGKPFTKATYEAEQAALLKPAVRVGELEAIRLELITAVERLASTASSSFKKDAIWLWTYKLEEALAALEVKFGKDDAVNQVGAQCYPEMKKLRPRIQPIMDKFSESLLHDAQQKIAQIRKMREFRPDRE